MKIIFLCGSLEPGRDGVGDYVRCLSAELIRQGHHIAAAGINDGHISEMQNSGLQGPEALSVLRLPSNLAEEDRMALLRVFIDSFNPEWISLQFVAFSFHPKGLTFGLASKLKAAGNGRKWQIMFHELWVGMSAEASRKETVWGKVQLLLIKSMIRKIQPKVIHTQSDLYKKQLERIGSSAELLPLFSNIQVVDPEQIKAKISRGIKIENKISIVVFGGIHVGGPISQLAKEAKKYADNHALEIELVIVGRNGKEQERWVKEWQSAGLTITQMGEQSAERVSEILSTYDFGFFTTPVALVEKSGSVAAMRAHGIHLLCVSREWNAEGIKTADNPYGISEYEVGGLAAFFEQKPDFSYMPTLSIVAEQFVNNLLISS
ncbi:MAG: hypothetical protein ABWY16_05870 [Pedobacter sp.]|uniref:hypothetical protein n=1 Tax=Pedobacter sp. TaxID=1411316 RepID=UPI0033969840